MPLRLLHKWPKAFGFEIYGNGPTYVISVHKGSMADKCGLRPGDQLLELNGSDVTTMSQQHIRALAKPRGFKPPEVKVVSCLQTLEISPELPIGYGFSIAGEKPVVVSPVQYGGPAYTSGLRTGDIILEVTNSSNLKLSALETILSQLPGPIKLLIIPVARFSNLVHMDKAMTTEKTPNPRLYTARDLYTKLDNSLGADQEAKSSVVAALKRYAEDRDLDVFCSSLNSIGATSGLHPNIIQKIRLLIPPAQRESFDDRMVSQTPIAEEVEMKDHKTVTGRKPNQLRHNGQIKLIQIVRDSGSFGFVVKSCSPAIIEAVDVGGPAQCAGLQDGDILLKLNGLDVRKIGHDRLIELLQDSGSAPILEIFRGSSDEFERSVDAVAHISSSLSESSLTSGSSHESAHTLFNNPMITDAEGKTFSEKVSHLLTREEEKITRDALRVYDTRRDVVALYKRLSAIWDTPSRQSLWVFVMELLPAVHQEYVSHRVALPEHSVGRSSQEPAIDSEDSDNFLVSSQHQLDFLLTAAERQQFKESLKRYEQTQELRELVVSLESILDSPSKRVLWRLVLPRLTDEHREMMGDQPNNPLNNDVSRADHRSLNITSMDSYIGEPEDTGFSTQETDQLVLFGTDQTQNEPHIAETSRQERSESSDDELDSLDDSSVASKSRGRVENSQQQMNPDNTTQLMQELEQTKKAVMEVRAVIMEQQRKSEQWPMLGMETVRASNFITVIPIGQDEANQTTLAAAGMPLTSTPTSLTSGDKTSNSESKMSLHPNTKWTTIFTKNRSFDESQIKSSDGEECQSEEPGDATVLDKYNRQPDTLNNNTPGTRVHHENPIQSFHHATQTQNTQQVPLTQPTQSTAQSQLSLHAHHRHQVPQTQQTHYTEHALLANSDTPHPGQLGVVVDDPNLHFGLKSPQANVGFASSPKREFPSTGPRKQLSVGLTKRWPSLAQVSAARTNSSGPESMASTATSHQKLVAQTSSSVATVAAPPPPPPPPPLPQSMSGFKDQGEQAQGKLSVKRINWEKLDNQKVENTIWEKLNAGDLSEVVKYLDLEAQFSTRPAKQRDVETKKEVLIMDQKKAYNISILLGHLKMSVPEVKQALYDMDEKALAPELIGQLLTFAPSDTETTQYKAYSGDLARLTKPDQFAQQMCHVGDYQERLKALLFKSSFKEKAEELRKDLQNIKIASSELKRSKKLARLLEVILAMGNYLNQGNPRVGEAAGFRITFLTQLDITKTTDKKSSFLHVLAETTYTSFPELLSFSDEVPTVEKAAKVSMEVLDQDIQDLQRNLHVTSATLSKVGEHSQDSTPTDRFQDVMGHFLAEATDELQSIFRLQAATMAEFNQMVSFFGENPKAMTTNDVFGIFLDFINNFEKAHRYNLMFKRQ